MHLLILGATGRTGVFGYKYALELGHHVTAIVRKASAIEPHDNLTVVEGSVLSEDDVSRAFTATGKPVDGVLQFLNPRRTSDNPWGAFIGPAGLLADSTALATKMLRKQRPLPGGAKPRLVVLNALGAGESYQATPYITRFIINYSNVSKTYDDHSAVDAQIEGNCGGEVDWTIAYAVGLGGAGLADVKTFGGTESGAGWMITRESLGRWMVDVAAGGKGEEFSNKRVIVSN